MTNEPLFMTMDASRFQNDLVRLLCRTARDNGRIEIVNCDGKSCVMISKDELDSLERALEILSDTEAGKALQHTVELFAAMTGKNIPRPV